jgi:hypothetical protein
MRHRAVSTSHFVVAAATAVIAAAYAFRSILNLVNVVDWMFESFSACIEGVQRLGAEKFSTLFRLAQQPIPSRGGGFTTGQGTVSCER